MTFNLRYAHTRPPDLWPDRLPVAVELIERWSPDIVGTQEGLYPQLKDLEATLLEYDWIGLGREGGARGEFMAVYYREDRFQPLDFDHFWLSDTPALIGSRSWGNEIPRMVTWIRFRDRRTDAEFYFVNTHFDHESQESRMKSAELLLRRVREWSPGLPVLLVGDFNTAAGANPVYGLLVRPDAFTDTWTTAATPGKEIGTFHGFQGVEAADGARIDWILSRGAVTTASTEIVTFHDGTQYPSDHFPVYAEVRIACGAEPPVSAAWDSPVPLSETRDSPYAAAESGVEN